MERKAYFTFTITTTYVSRLNFKSGGNIWYLVICAADNSYPRPYALRTRVSGQTYDEFETYTESSHTAHRCRHPSLHASLHTRPREPCPCPRWSVGPPLQRWIRSSIRRRHQASLLLRLVLGGCLVAYLVGRRELVRVCDIRQRLRPGLHRRDTRAATCHRRVEELAVLDAPGKELVCSGGGLRRPAHPSLLPATPRAALVARLAG